MPILHISPGNAIILSVETDSIVHTGMHDHEYLAGVAEEWIDTGEGIIEYWGTCEDGASTWRVHVHM